MNANVDTCALTESFLLAVKCVWIFTDINECTTNIRNCEQVCINYVGSDTCSCNNGYLLNADARCAIPLLKYLALHAISQISAQQIMEKVDIFVPTTLELYIYSCYVGYMMQEDVLVGK